MELVWIEVEIIPWRVKVRLISFKEESLIFSMRFCFDSFPLEIVAN